MADEDTLRSTKYYHKNERKQIAEQGGDEIVAGATGEDARHNPDKQQENRKKLRVNPDHKTPEMQKKHRGTYP